MLDEINQDETRRLRLSYRTCGGLDIFKLCRVEWNQKQSSGWWGQLKSGSSQMAQDHYSKKLALLTSRSLSIS